jgi:hypothetical protein
MSPYAAVWPEELKEVERAVLAELAKSEAAMSELLASLAAQFAQRDVKTAVWHLIDQGSIKMDRTRKLKVAA